MTVAIILLAAGMSSRTGKDGFHKLLAEFDGVPLLRRMVTAAVDSEAISVTVVLGHGHAEQRNILSGIEVQMVVNPDFALGMASSIGVGFVATEAQDADGIMVMLADMPDITTEHLDRMIKAFQDAGAISIVRAVSDGKPGNPVILPRSLRDAVLEVQGDVGARHLIKSSTLPVINIEIGRAAELDVDTLEEVAAAGGVFVSASTT
ncbi:nucleotidyltransferase family protein [Agrobacterium bohemicum]|uniref:Molybdopterin-guanine dinucleotide biosynthesis protein MobA n=1 Tax=Agrobacterium bohemicum TaxID=2052828 RepID=A0A135P8T4_9HYPH|nr:nucleotidyltransferase family protein [Agrobacterium bohemicum]KXG87834.1 molybdopterin-guanine dinucleotide biosynthesis protein MobA [Agrobacterium bohemicum]